MRGERRGTIDLRYLKLGAKTRNRDLLDLDSFEGIAILTSRQFLELADG